MTPTSLLQHPSLAYLQTKLSTRANKPRVLIICGSGLSGLSNSVQADSKLVVPYSDIPGFPQVTIQGHAGELVFGQISNVECMVLRGRFHFYEGHKMETCVLPVRLGKLLGCEMMIVTNASGGMRASFELGDVAVLGDHIGLPTLVGNGPLMGPNPEELAGARFPAMSNAYDAQLQRVALRCARELGFGSFVRSNATYCCVSGPQYESPAECRMLRMLGADCVGMSTVPEVIAARHCNLRTLALSLITNKVVLPGDVNPKHASHEEVLETTAKRSADVQRLVEHVLAKVSRGEEEQQEQEEKEQEVKPKVDRGGGPVAKRLRELDLSAITPLDSLQVLAELKRLAALE